LSDRCAVIAAGGTGGHLFPAQALAQVLSARGWRVVLATDERTAGLAQDFPAVERLVFASGSPTGALAARLRAVLALAGGVVQARRALKRLGPTVAVGFGGYPSVPPLLAARSLAIPYVIHEANAVMGRANVLLAGGARAIACAFPTLLKASPKVRARAVVVGNPVRPAILALADRPYQPPIEDGPLRLLVTGGSQGARILSRMVPAAAAALPAALRTRLLVVQQARPESLDFAVAAYRDSGIAAEVAPFFADMAGRLAAAHLIVARAGASTVGEIAVTGRPAVLVPLAQALDDDQGQNARLLAEAGAAVVLREADLTPAALAITLQELLGDPARLQRMAAAARAVATPGAAEALADLVERAATPRA
jgi:UDP-N-acetylglucosamine--N-acetylmuramyl-(pentapeptide) pyrophosphoryl-undecaprenol N-acetylglucosamine transferase